MSQIYTALSQGQPSPLPELSVQYLDYAAWQQQWLQGEELEKRLAYWRQQLADAPERISLPQRRARPRVQAFDGAKHLISMSPQQTEALRELARREGMTLFMTMLSGFALLLKQYTGDEDIVIGTVYANRDRAEAEKLIGILANTLMVRVNLAGAETFRDVMKRVRDVCLDAYSNQVSPEILREDMAKRGEERERLFDVWFQLEKEKQQLEMSGLEVSSYDDGKDVTRFELSLGLSERTETIMGMLEYDAKMFTSKTTAQMLEDYLSLLSLMIADPDQELSSLSLTRKSEIERLSSQFLAEFEV